MFGISQYESYPVEEYMQVSDKRFHILLNLLDKIVEQEYITFSLSNVPVTKFLFALNPKYSQSTSNRLDLLIHYYR
jgi:hypothetical protein